MSISLATIMSVVIQYRLYQKIEDFKPNLRSGEGARQEAGCIAGG